jgi:hypothetical protein
MYLYKQRISFGSTRGVLEVGIYTSSLFAQMSSAMGFQILDVVFTQVRQLDRPFFCHVGVP